MYKGRGRPRVSSGPPKGLGTDGFRTLFVLRRQMSRRAHGACAPSSACRARKRSGAREDLPGLAWARTQHSLCADA